jgi:UDP-3-O-[3-hydroxymyristoyl] glucosamine N-acyltransferase
MNSIKVKFSKIKHLIPNRNFDRDDKEIFDISNFKGYNYNYSNELTWIGNLDLNLCANLINGFFIVPQIENPENYPKNINFVFSDNPRLDFAKILQFIKNENKSPLQKDLYQEIGENSFVSKTAIIDPNVTIGQGVIIGHYTTILDGTKIMDNVIIGNNCCIGGKGFGYVFDDQLSQYIHLEHFGGVLIESNVEIGNGVYIDKAVFGFTRIASGVKIDNLSQIAHNTIIGENTLIMSNVTISGSCVIGSSCWISPSTTISNKITIGDNTKIGLGSVVTKNLRSDSFYLGYPIRRIE